MIHFITDDYGDMFPSRGGDYDVRAFDIDKHQLELSENYSGVACSQTLHLLGIEDSRRISYATPAIVFKDQLEYQISNEVLRLVLEYLT